MGKKKKTEDKNRKGGVRGKREEREKEEFEKEEEGKCDEEDEGSMRRRK